MACSVVQWELDDLGFDSGPERSFEGEKIHAVVVRVTAFKSVRDHN